MRSIVDWIKSIWKDPVWSKVISAGIIAVVIWIAKLFPMLRNILTYQIDLWLTLVFIIIAFFISKYYSSNQQKKAEQDHKQKVNKANNAAIQKERNDKIWLAFNGLEKIDLALLKAIYEMPVSDPDNKTSRMISKSAFSRYEVSIEKTKIYSGDRSYMPCIRIEYIGDKAHLTMKAYFYELLQHYCNTNEKNKL